jgi:hypothetical protein
MHGIIYLLNQVAWRSHRQARASRRLGTVAESDYAAGSTVRAGRTL